MIKINNNTWYITKDLNSANVPTIAKEYNKSIPAGDWCIDLSGCNHIDSSGLALLISYIKQAKLNNSKLKITGLNNDSLQLAKIHGVNKLLTEASQT